MLKRIRVLTVVLGMLAATAALAQTKSEPLAIALTHHKVAQAEGKEVLVNADTAKPGEVIEYRATYRNKSDKPLRSVEATLPIPAGTEVLPASVQPTIASASVDGVRFQPMPLKRKVKRADGKEVDQLVPYAEYRFLRWSVGTLEPGKVAVYAARVKVNTEGAIAPVAEKPIR